MGMLLLLMAWMQVGQVLLQSDRIFTPIKAGQEVGAVIIPGAYLTPDQYYDIAVKIQEASEFALWVIVEDTPTDTLIPRMDFVKVSRENLIQAGLAAAAPYIGIGHSMGGAIMVIELERNVSLANGFITWGADGFITPDNVPTFDYPAMILAGDLDGVTAITNMARQHRNLGVFPDEVRAMYPVRTVGGVNHGSFATGQMPPFVVARDIPAEVTGDIGRILIADDTAFFIDFCAKMAFGLNTDAEIEKLQGWLTYHNVLYQPIITALNLEKSPDEEVSPWVQEAQRILGEVQGDSSVRVDNYVMDKSQLMQSRSSLTENGDGTYLANTTTTVTLPLISNQAAEMLEAKLTSRDLFDDVMGRPPSGHPAKQCKDINVAAWNTVYSSLPEISRSRYDAREIYVTFFDDINQVWGPGWIESELQFSYDGSVLNVTASSLKTSVPLGGAQYCKLMSPYRAAQFFYVDALRPTS